MRRNRDKYMLELNSRSSSKSCVLLNAVRMRFAFASSSPPLEWLRGEGGAVSEGGLRGLPSCRRSLPVKRIY